MSDVREEPASGRAGDASKQIQGHLKEKKERLQNELTDFLSQATEEDLDGDRLDSLLAALDEVDPLPELETYNPRESLRQFHEKYADVFSAIAAEPAAASTSSPEKKPFHHTFAKFLPIAAVLVLLMGSVTAQAFGVNLFGAIARWTSEIFRLSDSSTPYATIETVPLAKGETAYYDTLEEAVEAFGISAPIVPQWIPERFELAEVTATYQTAGVLIYADYLSESDGGSFQIRYNEASTVNFSTLEQESDNVETHLASGIIYYLLYDLGYEKALWQNGELECRMSGTVSGQEMKDIIDSIY